MTIKEIAAKIFAIILNIRTQLWLKNPIASQQKIFTKLLKSAAQTKFGNDHNFHKIRTYADFRKQVPVRDYEQLKNYFELVKEGKQDILWPGKPIYFCKTSGTTSGIKYIPITKDSLPNHINSARNALLSYISDTGNTKYLNGKMIFLQGSPQLDEMNGIPLGRLSGIVAHHVPKYLLRNRMPSLTTNCIDDWEEKIDAIVRETINENMTLISGIPPWVQMYFEKLQQRSNGKPIHEIFPNLDLMVFGGVNFEPYAKSFKRLIGKQIDQIEVFPASEGFFAYQDKQKEKGLLLLLNDGIFYEFIKAGEFHSESSQRISIEDVELNVNYVLILSSNAGLWAYNIGDTIKFVSLKPHRIVVTGRIKHFISAFGEHVIAEEVQWAVKELSAKEDVEINEFTVAPKIQVENGELPHHEWFIEFKNEPENMEKFRLQLDHLLCTKNTYYNDLICGNILQPLRIKKVEKNGFNLFMKDRGKLGGQNKIPHLSNNRKIADELGGYIIH